MINLHKLGQSQLEKLRNENKNFILDIEEEILDLKNEVALLDLILTEDKGETLEILDTILDLESNKKGLEKVNNLIKEEINNRYEK